MGSRERRGRKNNNNKNDDPITRTKLGDLYPRDSLLPQHQVSEATIVGVDKSETLPNRPPCSEMDFPAIIGHSGKLSRVLIFYYKGVHQYRSRSDYGSTQSFEEV